MKLRKKFAGVSGVEIAIAVVVVIIAVSVGAVVVGNLQGAIDTTSSSSLPSAARSAINNTFTQGWSGYGLLAIIAIVIAASAIIAVVVGFGRVT